MFFKRNYLFLTCFVYNIQNSLEQSHLILTSVYHVFCFPKVSLTIPIFLHHIVRTGYINRKRGVIELGFTKAREMGTPGAIGGHEDSAEVRRRQSQERRDWRVVYENGETCPARTRYVNISERNRQSKEAGEYSTEAL